MKSYLASFCYILVGCLSMILLELPSLLPGLAAKALIIPLLMTLFAINLNPFESKSHRLIFAGLFFSWAGDVILQFARLYDFLFIAGLLFFMIAQVMYLMAFLNTPGRNLIFRSRFYLLIPVVIYGIVLIAYLYDDLAAMRLPVILYAVVILTMVCGAVTRLKKVPALSFYLVLAGAALFVISDSVIAINRFSHKFDSAEVLTMSTYIVAQFLIVTGYIKQFRGNFE